MNIKLVPAALCFLACLALTVSCGYTPPKAPVPPVSDAIYDPTRTMIYSSNAQMYSTHFDGVMSYKYPSGCENVPFSFTDHPSQPAQLQVWITDTAGVKEGDEFDYRLVFASPDGSTQEIFKLTVSNPLGSGSPRVYSFPPFLIQLNATTPDLKWNVAGQQVVGTYSIVSSRDMSVSLQFKLRQTVSGAAGPACNPPT